MPGVQFPHRLRSIYMAGIAQRQSAGPWLQSYEFDSRYSPVVNVVQQEARRPSRIYRSRGAGDRQDRAWRVHYYASVCKRPKRGDCKSSLSGSGVRIPHGARSRQRILTLTLRRLDARSDSGREYSWRYGRVAQAHACKACHTSSILVSASYGPVVQWTELPPPKRRMGVRIPPGSPLRCLRYGHRWVFS